MLKLWHWLVCPFPNRATPSLHPAGWKDCMVREEQLLVAWAVLVSFSMLGSLLIGRYYRCTKRRFDPLCDLTGDGCDEHRLPDHDMHMPTVVCEDALLPNFSLAQCQSVRLDMGDITGKPIQPNKYMHGMESCNPALAPRRMCRIRSHSYCIWFQLKNPEYPHLQSQTTPKP